jgi:hypothetical protein
MDQKINKTFNVALIKNLEYDGAWLSIITIKDNDEITSQMMNTWQSTRSAQKWINNQVNLLTKYREIYLNPSEEKDLNGNYIFFSGSLNL